MKIKLRPILLFSQLCLVVASCNAKLSTESHDTTINGKIKLRNSASAESNLGDAMARLDTTKDLPDVFFKNKTGTEFLRLVFFPGDNKNTFSVFEVSKANANQNASSSSFANFTTESGIKLGLSKAEVIKRSGKDYKEIKSENATKLRYEIDEKKDKEFLTRYNMPLYFVEYIFKNDLLEKYTLGFEYP